MPAGAPTCLLLAVFIFFSDMLLSFTFPRSRRINLNTCVLKHSNLENIRAGLGWKIGHWDNLQNQLHVLRWTVAERKRFPRGSGTEETNSNRCNSKPTLPDFSSKIVIKLRWKSTRKQAARDMEAFCSVIFQGWRVFQVIC